MLIDVYLASSFYQRILFLNKMSLTTMFSRKNFASIAKQALAEMWNYAKKGFFYDVILIAAEDGTKIPTHRAVLSAVNEFFKTMFCSQFKESNEKEVIIYEISGDVLRSLIRYCYTGTIDINEDNVQLILPQASLMMFPEIIEACSAFLISSINPRNCLSMIKYAKLYNCQALTESAENYMKTHFLNIVATEEFLKLSQQELEEYLSFNELNVDSEKDVFQAMMRWINHDFETRICAFFKLLPLIRIRDIDHEYLFDYVINNHHHHSLLNAIINAQFNSMPVRTRPKANQIVFVCSKKIQVYNALKNVIEFEYNIPDCGSFKPTLLEEKVILVGCKGKVRCFDLNTRSLFDLPPTLARRNFCSVAMLNKSIYAIGGLLNGKTVNTVERWNSKLNMWSEVAKMNYPRINHCTAILNGKLYAIGGWQKGVCLNSVECYDSIKEQWSICCPLITAREYAKAVVANGEIFVFGGKKSDSQTLNCIEKYNPETNTWTKVSQMTDKRSKMGAYLYNKNIYLFGGFDGNEWLKSMEELNPFTNECKLIDTPNIKYDGDLYCFPYMS